MSDDAVLAVVTRSSEETRALGAAIAAVVRKGDEVYLEGELGSGKTTLTKGFVAALGGGEVVTSPTFTLCHRYACHPPVAHVDCFRIDPADDLSDLALGELLEEGYVVVAEWAARAASLSSSAALVCRLETGEDESWRHVEIDFSAPSWVGRRPDLVGALATAGLTPSPGDEQAS